MHGFLDIRNWTFALALAAACGLPASSVEAQVRPGNATGKVDAASGFSISRQHLAEPSSNALEQNRVELAQAVGGQSAYSDDNWHWQLAPVSLLYKSYLAGEKEPRIASVWMSDTKRGLLWENALGARVGVVRFGNENVLRPQGWQFDLEGAALPRVVPQDPSSPLEATDYRVGLLSTWRYDDTAIKAGYYHLSSHIGDEYLINNPTFQRINYVRDSAIIGVTQYFLDDFSVYGEVAYAFNAEDGAEPIELQYGLQYSPLTTGWPGAPFAAINGHTRQDYEWATSVTVQGGWQWRSGKTNHTLRVGMQYYKGPSMQWELGNVQENMLGGGIWYDF
jgi:hypothetical protein